MTSNGDGDWGSDESRDDHHCAHRHDHHASGDAAPMTSMAALAMVDGGDEDEDRDGGWQDEVGWDDAVSVMVGTHSYDEGSVSSLYDVALLVVVATAMAAVAVAAVAAVVAVVAVVTSVVASVASSWASSASSSAASWMASSWVAVVAYVPRLPRRRLQRLL